MQHNWNFAPILHRQRQRIVAACVLLGTTLLQSHNYLQAASAKECITSLHVHRRVSSPHGSEIQQRFDCIRCRIQAAVHMCAFVSLELCTNPIWSHDGWTLQCQVDCLVWAARSCRSYGSLKTLCSRQPAMGKYAPVCCCQPLQAWSVWHAASCKCFLQVLATAVCHNQYRYGATVIMK